MDTKLITTLQSILCFLVFPIIPSSSSPLDLNLAPQGCQPVRSHSSHMSACARWFPHTQLPNVFGHAMVHRAMSEMNNALAKVSNPSDEVLAFMCAMFLPPCPPATSEPRDRMLPLPCRSLCQLALNSASKQSGSTGFDSRSWPVMCHTLPTAHCYALEGPRRSTMTLVKKSPPSSVLAQPRRQEEIAKFSSIDTELGDSDTTYDVEVVTVSDSQERGRRYDITDLGDPDFFQGWADVQGQGSANDYCRVIGKLKRRFLSCNLAGSQSQGHHYVSKLGFDIGYPGTWFMRDMDADGRDDYCRCVGPPSDSKVTCMKAGERGFYGSPMQSGSQHTFVLASSRGCHVRKVNAFFGE